MLVYIRFYIFCVRNSTDELLVAVTLASKEEFAECKIEAHLGNLKTVIAITYHPHKKKKGNGGLVNSNNEETVLLSKFKLLLKHEKREMDNY